MVSTSIGAGSSILGKYLLRDSLTIFVYHDVINKPSQFSGEYDLNVTPEIFDFQIRFIRNNFNIISPDDLLAKRATQKAALITFDDGFKSYFTNALPILEKLKVPSVIFLNMEPVNGGVFWSGLITYLCKEKGFVEYLKKTAYDMNLRLPNFLHCSRKIVFDYLEKSEISLDKKVNEFVGEFADKEDLKHASLNPLVFYGNHLFNHDVPAVMSDHEFIDSFNKNNEELKQYLNYRNLFSFPFGQEGSCYKTHQVELLADKKVGRIFSSMGGINRNLNAACLDRIALTSFHDSVEKIWFGIFYKELKNRFFPLKSYETYNDSS
jgi:hypothetical protein